MTNILVTGGDSRFANILKKQRVNIILSLDLKAN